MKALVKKYPINARYESENEVYEEPRWLEWVDKDTGAPCTDENNAYAMCLDCPEDVELTVEDFDVQEFTKEVKDDMGEVQTVKYWMATYIKKE